MSARRLTADKREKLRALAEVLSGFLPLSAQSKKATTFKSIFKESNIDKYLQDLPKKKALISAWEKVYKHHQKLPYTLIRKIVAAAVDYRKHKRNPLKCDELNKLSAILKSLGIDMELELSRIELVESIPEIQVPPAELIRRIQDYPLCEEIAGEPLELFKNGHFNESVRKAAERFEHIVQQKSGRTEQGKGLMSTVFSLKKPLLPLNSLKTGNEKNIQEGYMHLTMGAMTAIRNIFSHGDETQRSPEEAYEMLMYLNWLFRHLPH